MTEVDRREREAIQKVHDCHGDICSGNTCPADVAISRLADLAREYERRWGHIQGCDCHDEPYCNCDLEEVIMCGEPGLANSFAASEATGAIAALERENADLRAALDNANLMRDREWSNRLQSQDTVRPDSPDLDLALAWYVHQQRKP